MSWNRDQTSLVEWSDLPILLENIFKADFYLPCWDLLCLGLLTNTKKRVLASFRSHCAATNSQVQRGLRGHLHAKTLQHVKKRARLVVWLTKSKTMTQRESRHPLWSKSARCIRKRSFFLYVCARAVSFHWVLRDQRRTRFGKTHFDYRTTISKSIQVVVTAISAGTNQKSLVEWLRQLRKRSPLFQLAIFSLGVPASRPSCRF